VRRLLTALTFLLFTSCQSHAATSYSDPLSTGNRTASIAATDSGDIWTIFTDSEQLVDGVTGGSNGTIYNFTAAVAGKYVQFDLGTEKVMDTFRTWANGSATDLATWQWQGSNDGSSFTSLGSSFLWTMSNGTSSEVTEPSGNTTAYRYYRLIGISGNGNATNFNCELEFKLGDAGPAPSTFKTKVRIL